MDWVKRFFKATPSSEVKLESRRRSESGDTSPVMHRPGFDFGMCQRTVHPPTGRVAGQKPPAPQRHQFFGMLQAAV